MAPDGTIYGIELLNANEQLKRDKESRLLVVNEATGETMDIPFAVKCVEYLVTELVRKEERKRIENGAIHKYINNLFILFWVRRRSPTLPVAVFPCICGSVRPWSWKGRLPVRIPELSRKGRSLPPSAVRSMPRNRRHIPSGPHCARGKLHGRFRPPARRHQHTGHAP